MVVTNSSSLISPESSLSMILNSLSPTMTGSLEYSMKVSLSISFSCDALGSQTLYIRSLNMSLKYGLIESSKSAGSSSYE